MTAVVLAGQRDGENELAQYAGATCKAFVEINGQPMLSRVLDTLASCSGVGGIILSGPNKDKLDDQIGIRNRIQSGEVRWLSPQGSPSASAYEAMRPLGPGERVLVTTADHPLLSTEMIDYFFEQCAGSDADVLIGLAPYSLVREAFPTMKKTVLRFRNAELCGCNLFAFLTPKGREAANFWQSMESQRKKPLRLIRFLGGWTVARYLVGVLTLEDALNAFSMKLGIKIHAALMPFADAAVDVDSVSDYVLVQERLSKRVEGRSTN